MPPNPTPLSCSNHRPFALCLAGSAGEREAATFLGYSQAEWDAELQVADVAPPASVATQPQPAASSAAYPPPLAPVVGNANGAGAWATVSTSKRPASKPPPVVHPSAGPTPTMALDGVTKFTSGMMFGCKKDTYDENMQRMLFGLPEHHFKIAQNINDTTGLFLFNYSTKQLHGIFVSRALAVDPANAANAPTRPAAWPLTKVQLAPLSLPLSSPAPPMTKETVRWNSPRRSATAQPASTWSRKRGSTTASPAIRQTAHPTPPRSAWTVHGRPHLRSAPLVPALQRCR